MVFFCRKQAKAQRQSKTTRLAETSRPHTSKSFPNPKLRGQDNLAAKSVRHLHREIGMAGHKITVPKGGLEEDNLVQGCNSEICLHHVASCSQEAPNNGQAVPNWHYINKHMLHLLQQSRISRSSILWLSLLKRNMETHNDRFSHLTTRAMVWNSGEITQPRRRRPHPQCRI